jgi:hypothetical protein
MKLPKVNGRRLRQVTVAVVVIAAMAAGWSFVQGFLSFRRDLQTTHLIKLGDSRAEVAYRLGYPPMVLGAREPVVIGGKPVGFSSRVFYVTGPKGDENTMPPSQSANDYNEWMFSPDDVGTDLLVEFDKADKVRGITCTAHDDNPFACWLAGRWNGDTEEVVLKLGTPTRTTITDVSKSIDYEDIGVGFTLTRGKAYSFRRTEPTAGEVAIMRRYINTTWP